MKSYHTLGGTVVLRRHLEEFYEILRESLRDVTVKNIQRSLQDAFAQAEANPQKRRRLDTEEVS